MEWVGRRWAKTEYIKNTKAERNNRVAGRGSNYDILERENGEDKNHI